MNIKLFIGNKKPKEEQIISKNIPNHYSKMIYNTGTRKLFIKNRKVILLIQELMDKYYDKTEEQFEESLKQQADIYIFFEHPRKHSTEFLNSITVFAEAKMWNDMVKNNNEKLKSKIGGI